MAVIYDEALGRRDTKKKDIALNTSNVISRDSRECINHI